MLLNHDIDCMILSYMDDDYNLYKLCKLNSYLKGVYEDNNLWILKINDIFENLVIPKVNNVKKLYFDIKNTGIEELYKYAIKNNYSSILDWVIKYHGNTFGNNNKIMIHDFVTIACRYGNLDIIKYIVDTFGCSEENILSRNESFRLYYIISKNKKCVEISTAYTVHNILIYGHIHILKYLDEYGVKYYYQEKIKTKIEPNYESVKKALENGHFESVDWVTSRHYEQLTI